MEDHLTVLPEFKVKIAIDTQVLAYLLDNTYPQLTQFFQCLFDCPFAEIVVSRFTTFEFIGVRKLEHYLRAIHAKTNENGGIMGFSSVLKYKNDWSAPELPYQDVINDIKQKVEEDLRKVNDDFGIIYSDGIHDDLWGPHQDLVLSSKISKEDSLVLLSNILTPEGSKEDYIIFLTNDDQFYRASCTDLKMDEVDQVFTKHRLNRPQILKLAKVLCPINKKSIDLLKGRETEYEIKSFCKNFILENIRVKNSELLLGKVMSCPAKMKGLLLCFHLLKDHLNDNLYISVVSKDLEFIYNHPVKLSGFHNIAAIQNYPYVPDEEETSRNISVRFTDEEGNSLPDELYTQATTNGNLIFLHPHLFLV